MGDGRYYSLGQFFNIIILTLAVIFLTVNLMLAFYKEERHGKGLSLAGGLLLVALVGRFLAEVAVSPIRIELGNYLFYGMSIGHIVMCIAIDIRYLVEAKKSQTINWRTPNRKTMSYIMGTVVLILGVLFLVKVDWRIPIVVILTGHFGFLVSYLTEYRISSSIFTDVKKLMLDYVFIVGVEGEILFKNDRVAESTFFKKVVSIDKENIGDLFKGRVVFRQDFAKQFIKVEGDTTAYFQYNQKSLKEKGQPVAYILTFVDISELVNMLDQIEAQHHQATELNNQLARYKEKVYELEREKEINNLLDEIADNQRKSLLILEEKIGQLKITDDSFDEQVEQLIFLAKADLKDVRQAVTTYIDYYEQGEADD